MVKRNKSLRKGRKRTQKGGFFDSLKKMVGLSGGDETQLQKEQSPGIFGSVTNFFGDVTQKGEELLTKGQGKLQEGLSAVGDKVSEGRESLGNVISGSTNQNKMAPNQNQITVDKSQMITDQNQMIADQNAMAVKQNDMAIKENAMAGNTVGGRKKKSMNKLMKGGRGLGLTYYASPVHGLRVAQPTYWISGGKRRRSTFKRRRSTFKRRRSKTIKKTRHKRR